MSPNAAISANNRVKQSRQASRFLRSSGSRPGLEERDLAARGHRDLLRVDVDREHVVAEVGQADGVGEAEVSGPDDGDPRQLALLLVECSLSILTHQRL